MRDQHRIRSDARGFGHPGPAWAAGLGALLGACLLGSCAAVVSVPFSELRTIVLVAQPSHAGDGDGSALSSRPRGLLRTQLERDGCYEMRLEQQRARGCLEESELGLLLSRLEEDWSSLHLVELRPTATGEWPMHAVEFRTHDARRLALRDADEAARAGWAQSLVIAVERNNQLPSEGEPVAGGWTGFELSLDAPPAERHFVALSSSGRWRCGFERGEVYEVQTGALDPAEAQQLLAAFFADASADDLAGVGRREAAPSVDLRAWNRGFVGRLPQQQSARRAQEWLASSGLAERCWGER